MHGQSEQKVSFWIWQKLKKNKNKHVLQQTPDDSSETAETLENWTETCVTKNGRWIGDKLIFRGIENCPKVRVTTEDFPTHRGACYKDCCDSPEHLFLVYLQTSEPFLFFRPLCM